MAKKLLKAWLKKNPLTEDPNDYAAVLSSNGSATEDDLIDEIMSEGIELKRDTVKSVVTRYNNKVVDKVLSGYNVNTGLAYLRPIIKGAFYDKTWNPTVNYVHINVEAGAALRKAAADVAIEILGVHADMIELFSITDLFTGKTDGSLTKGRNAELKGSYIKLAGDDPAVGLTFRNLATQVETRLSASDIVMNEPSRLLLFIPDALTSGEYELTVTTQFTGGGSTLKQPRSVTLGIPVFIG
jgi:hypothetical protein